MPISFSNVATLPNELLASLPQVDWDLLRRDVRRRYVVAGQYLYERGQDPEHVFFVEDGVAAMVARGQSGRRTVQVAMIGNEGMVGGLSLLSNGPASTDAIMLFPGTVLSIPIGILQQRAGELLTLRQACMQYLWTLVSQIMEISADSAQQNLVQRCVKWLLMAHDRMGDSDLFVTHDIMASLLGVRRPGVTLAIAALQDEGLIQASRGRIRIVQRDDLEAVCMKSSAYTAPSSGRPNELASSRLERRSSITDPIYGLPMPARADKGVWLKT